MWQIDSEIARLSGERYALTEQMRQDWAAAYAKAQPSGTSEGEGVEPGMRTRKTSPSASAVLVGLGALLLVIAGIVFAVVTWDRLGAGGQAAVLLAATGVAIMATVGAARAELAATAEALSVVVAGFALLDVHAFRIFASPSDDWQWVWAFGLVVVSTGLLKLGASASLRAPQFIALVTAQLPLVFLASIFADPSLNALAISSALLATAVLDQLVAHSTKRTPRQWLPAQASNLLHVAGTATWLVGTIVALPWAFGGGTGQVESKDRLWAILVLSAAAGAAALLSTLARPVRWPNVVAAGASTLTGMATVLAIAATFADERVHLVLVANGVAVVPLAGWLIVDRRSGALDVRERLSQMSALTWSSFSMIWWLQAIAGAIGAPFDVLESEGWWTKSIGVTTGNLAIPPDMAVMWGDTRAPGEALIAVLFAIAVGALAAASFGSKGGRWRRWSPPAIGLAGTSVALGILAVQWDIPVLIPVAGYLALAVLVIMAAAQPGRNLLPWVGLGSAPMAIMGLAWAGSVDVYTVAFLSIITVVSALAVVRGVAEHHEVWTFTTTATTVAAMAASAFAVSLTVGSSDQVAWTVSLTAVATASSIGWVADRWAPWWSLAVDVICVAAAGVVMVGLASSASADWFSIGLTVLMVAAGAHVLRPQRKAVAASIAASAGVLLSWVQLWDADVRSVEAYSIPAALLLLAAGWRQLGRNPELGSWPTLGAPLAIAATPSLAVALAEAGSVRPLVLLVVAVAVAIIGAALRLQAPLVVGTAVTAISAFDQLFPIAARLPRWIVLAIAGIVLLLVGSTFERQRQRVVVAYRRYSELQ